MGASQGDAHIFPSQSPGNGLAETGLAHSRRAVETEYGGFHIALELEHGQIFYDPVLHLVQPVVVLVEHLLGVLEVQVVLGDVTPGQVEHKLQVIVLYAVVRGRRVVALKLGQFLIENLLDLRGPDFLFSSLAQTVELLHVVHSELLLNGFELVVEVILPLLLVYLALYLGVDVLLDLHQFQLVVQLFEQGHCPSQYVVLGEQRNLLCIVLRLHRGRDEVGEELEVIDAAYGIHRLLWDEASHFHQGCSPVFDGVCNHLRLAAVIVCRNVSPV